MYHRWADHFVSYALQRCSLYLVINLNFVGYIFENSIERRGLQIDIQAKQGLGKFCIHNSVSDYFIYNIIIT